MKSVTLARAREHHTFTVQQMLSR